MVVYCENPYCQNDVFFLGWSDTPKEDYLGKDLGFGVVWNPNWEKVAREGSLH